MSIWPNSFRESLCVALHVAALIASPHTMALNDRAEARLETYDTGTPIHSLATTLHVGDVVFIRVSAKPFREVAIATGSWTNHVGIVIDTDGEEPLIGESTFPFSRTTTLSRFVTRSEGGHVAVARLKVPLTSQQRRQVFTAANQRSGILYDTGFNIHSHRQFCSRYVREVLNEATGINIGEVETFATLLSRRPETDLSFWRVWYFGHIPWERKTVTPASLLHSPELQLIFDGITINDKHGNCRKSKEITSC